MYGWATSFRDDSSLSATGSEDEPEIRYVRFREAHTVGGRSFRHKLRIRVLANSTRAADSAKWRAERYRLKSQPGKRGMKNSWPPCRPKYWIATKMCLQTSATYRQWHATGRGTLIVGVESQLVRGPDKRIARLSEVLIKANERKLPVAPNLCPPARCPECKPVQGPPL